MRKAKKVMNPFFEKGENFSVSALSAVKILSVVFGSVLFSFVISVFGSVLFSFVISV